MGNGKQQPAIRLIAIASSEERDIFARACMAVADVSDGDDGHRVLLVGRGMAARLPRHVYLADGTIDLLVANDETVLDDAPLLARCANVLVAPYDDAALLDCLSASVAGDDHPHVRGNIVGNSPRIRELLRLMAAVARYDAPVLLKGETGTGKELVARGIHYSSARRDQPFVPVNCGALNDDLLIAELFGYEKGAFTDAKRTHRGLVAQASGGVLFLDEIDSLSPKGQAALLRFLQEQEYRPIGSETLHRSDVRVVSATNKDLAELVARNRFREDLYYRIHLLEIDLPPLRERERDVLLLAEHFLDQFNRRYGADKRLHPMTARWMAEYAWPGNVRELQNYLFRVFVLSRGPVICIPDVKGAPLSWSQDAPPEDGLRSFRDEKVRALREFERTYLERVMRVAGGNVSLAARHAGKERSTFRRLLKKHGIDRESYDIVSE